MRIIDNPATGGTVRDVFIVDACRTPMGRLGGQLSFVRPDDLAAHVIRRLVSRNDLDPADIEDVHWGAANQAGEDNRNIGRMAPLLAGLPVEVTGTTHNRLCGSGLQAVVSAAHSIIAGWGDLMIAGGSESMSRAPHVTLKPESGFAVGSPESADSVLGWRFVNPEMQRLYPPISLGMTAEVVAERNGISRTDQDQFALESHQKAVAAIDAGRFDAEIESITVPRDVRRRSTIQIDRDEGPRRDTSLDALAALRPVFKEGGTVTAGNSSPMNDGAAGVVLASGEWVERNGIIPMARIVTSAVAGVHPDVMGIGPVPATRKAMQRAGIAINDFEAIELNEAFASQSVAAIRELGADPDVVNANGGAIALGHPLGGSGARILTTLVHVMEDRGSTLGLAAMCIGVGQGIALIAERA
jgi:3-oxoadipyl-CoA thiolase